MFQIPDTDPFLMSSAIAKADAAVAKLEALAAPPAEPIAKAVLSPAEQRLEATLSKAMVDLDHRLDEFRSTTRATIAKLGVWFEGVRKREEEEAKPPWRR